MKRVLCLLLSLVLTAALLVPTAFADSKADQVKAVLETTLAYYYKNPYMQYDSTTITNANESNGGTLRTNRYVAPEFGTAQRNLYTVCSSFCWEVYYNTFGYQLMENPRNAETINLAKAEAPLMVFSYKNGTGDDAAKLEEFRKTLEPADIIVYRSGDAGHAMMYVGAIDGDGVDYIIHSQGGKYNMTSGVDSTEPNGNIAKEPIDETLMKVGHSRYLGKATSFHILRPLAADCKDCAVLPVAKQRVKYSGLSVDRTVSCGLYGSPATGEELTYSLVIKNNSKSAYTVPVKETVPTGTAFVSAEGLTASGTTLSGSVSLNAGESKTVSFTVKVTAPRGTLITCGGGSVAEIPSNVLKNRVSGKTVDAAKLQDTAWRSTVEQQKPTGWEFANAVYREALGIGLGLTKTADITATIFKIGGRTATYESNLEAAKGSDCGIMVPDNYIGGAAYLTDWESINDRIFELRPEQLQAGDIFVACGNIKDSSPTVWVSTGKELLSCENGKIKDMKVKDMEKLMKKNLFFALRPSLAYDDVTTLVPEVKLPFTDVKEADWFYPFVKELYEKKIVAGMTDTTFVPGGKLTYGQALKLIVCGLGKGEQPAGTHWASGYLTFAKEQKWLDRDVDLNGEISRLAFCQIAAKAKGLTVQPAANPFTDCADKDVLALVNAGIINGMTATTFEPNTILTRAQISKIISGLIK